MKITDETRPLSEKSSSSFCTGVAHGGARTCRSATDSKHFRLSWKDKFPQFRMFRNCGR